MSDWAGQLSLKMPPEAGMPDPAGLVKRRRRVYSSQGGRLGARQPPRSEEVGVRKPMPGRPKTIKNRANSRSPPAMLCCARPISCASARGPGARQRCRLRCAVIRDGVGSSADLAGQARVFGTHRSPIAEEGACAGRLEERARHCAGDLRIGAIVDGDGDWTRRRTTADPDGRLNRTGPTEPHWLDPFHLSRPGLPTESDSEVSPQRKKMICRQQTHESRTLGH